MATTAAYTIARFHAEALALLDTLGDTPAARAEIQHRLLHLATQPDILPAVELRQLHDTGSTATILHEGPDGRGALMLLRLPAEAPTPVHNHNTWGIAVVIAGRNRYWRWERHDDGADPTRGDLRLAEVFDHGPGEAVAWDEPPHDWHAQQGIDQAAYEFVFFGVNPNRQPRAYYDSATGAITHADATR